MREKGLLKEKEDSLEGEDVREGLAAVISVKLRNPQFEARRRRSSATRRSRASSSKSSIRSWPSSSRRTRRTRARSSRRRSRPRAPGWSRAQSARVDASQECAREHVAAGQAQLLDQKTGVGRAVHRRGLRRQLAKMGRDRTYQAILPCAGRSSARRRTGSTRFSRTTRSRR